MKAEITIFPYGAAQGLPMLRLDFEGAPWSSSKATAAKARNAAAVGIWGIWLDGLETWECEELDTWIREQESVVALRKLGEEDWPAADVATVLDVTEAMEHGTDIKALASFVAARSNALPIVQELVAVLGPEHRTPLVSALELLSDFASPLQSYIYAPSGHPEMPLLVRALAQCSAMWAVRSPG